MRNAATVFEYEYSGARNFMTPHVLGYRELPPKFYIELSEGESIFDRSAKIYGVTVLETDHTSPRGVKRRPDLSKGGFPTYALAERYVSTLAELAKA